MSYRNANPYAGLSDGIQQGLRSIAQADVEKSAHGIRMAELELDNKRRQEDYTLRLNQDKRLQAQAERDEYNHRMTQLERNRQEFESRFSLIQNADGSVNWKDPNAQKVISDVNFMLKNDPYAVQTIGTVLGVRTGDKDTLQLELMPNGSGLAAVTSSSKDPNLRGVLTENASKDPDDPVMQVSGESVRQIVNVTKKAEMLGASPAATAYFLNARFGLGGNGQFEATPEIQEEALMLEREIDADAAADSVTSRLGRQPSGISPEQIRPVQDQPMAMPAAGAVVDGLGKVADNDELRDKWASYRQTLADPNSSGIKKFGAQAQYYSSILPATGEAIFDSAKGVVNSGLDNIKGMANTFAEGWDSWKGEQPSTDNAAPVQQPASQPPVQEQVNSRGHITTDLTKPGTNTQDLFANFSQTFVGKAAKISEADRRAFFAAADNEKRHVKAMGRYLLSQSLKPGGDMTPAQAATLYESGRADAIALDRLARQQPSEAEVITKWMMTGGAKGKTEDGQKAIRESLERKSKFIQGVTSSINSVRGNKGEDPVYDPAVSGGIDDALAFMGYLHPEDQEMFLLKHEGNLREAMAKFASNQSRFIADGRKSRAAMAQTFVSAIRQGAYMPPSSLEEPEDQQQYMDQTMEIFATYSGDPLAHVKIDKAVELYHKIVEQHGFGKVPVGQVIDKVNEIYQPKK